MPVTIDKPIAIISEGDADKFFIEKLLQHRMAEERCCLPFPNRTFFSSSMFDKMLSGIKGDAIGYKSLRGVVIIADSCDSPGATFTSIARQVAQAGGFAIPTSIGVIAVEEGVPSVCVHTLPDDGRVGGLETLFSEDLAVRHPAVDSAANAFLARTPAVLGGWNSEKQSKARFATLVAATHQDDPSRAAAYAWRHPPTVEIQSSAFDLFVTKLLATINGMMA